MTMIYYPEDGNLDALGEAPVGLIGYGSGARAIAMNMRDHGVNLLVSSDDAAEQRRAQADGFTIGMIGNVVRQCAVIVLALTDEVMTTAYMQSVSPNLTKGDTLIFISAYNVTFGFIEPPPFVDVGLVAPRSIGELLRHAVTTGDAVPSFVAVWQDASRQAWQRVLAVALAMGAVEGGAVEVNIEQEAELSLFVQQAIIPAFHHIIVTAADLLMKQGYPPEAVLMDLYLTGKFAQYIEEAGRSGILQALRHTSTTGQYSTYSRMARFSELKLERLMEVTLDEIRSGDFSREWSQEQADGQPRLRKLLKQYEARDLWDLEQQTLDLIGEDPEDWSDEGDNDVSDDGEFL